MKQKLLACAAFAVVLWIGDGVSTSLEDGGTRELQPLLNQLLAEGLCTLPASRKRVAVVAEADDRIMVGGVSLQRATKAAGTESRGVQRVDIAVEIEGMSRKIPDGTGRPVISCRLSGMRMVKI